MYHDDRLFEDDEDEDDSDEGDEEEGEEEQSSAGYKKSMMGPISAMGDRNSTVTIQTRASNLLPIAYIPGVTNGSGTVSGSGSGGLSSRLFRGLNTSHLNNTGDIRSHITLGSSILGGIDDEEEQEEEELKNEKTMKHASVSSNNKSVENLTTAIRAKPKLVQIAEEDAGEEKGKGNTAESVDFSEKHQEQGAADDTADHSIQERGPEEHNHAEDIVLFGEDYDDDDDDDGEGSFILDLAIPDSIRPSNGGENTGEHADKQDEDSGSPFEDKFKIDEDSLKHLDF